MKIITKYIGPTDYTGAKVIATIEGKKRPQVTIGFHSSLDPHTTAAAKLVEKIGERWADWQTCYRIVRVFEDKHPSQVLLTGLTIEQAQAHCKNPETSSSTCSDEWAWEEKGRWFDCFEHEGWTNIKEG